MSEGEEYISQYLEDEGFDYRVQEMIEGLVNDSKSHRLADFYLPKYKVYIEYFGQWNVEAQRERYMEKRRAYIANKIPCIFLYPENLGILNFIFHKRLVHVLERYKMEKELKAYHLREFYRERQDNFVMLLISCVILFFAWPWTDPENKTLFFIGAAMFVYQCYLIVKSLRSVYRESYPNTNIPEE